MTLKVLSCIKRSTLCLLFLNLLTLWGLAFKGFGSCAPVALSIVALRTAHTSVNRLSQLRILCLQVGLQTYAHPLAE